MNKRGIRLGSGICGTCYYNPKTRIVTKRLRGSRYPVEHEFTHLARASSYAFGKVKTPEPLEILNEREFTMKFVKLNKQGIRKANKRSITDAIEFIRLCACDGFRHSDIFVGNLQLNMRGEFIFLDYGFAEKIHVGCSLNDWTDDFFYLFDVIREHIKKLPFRMRNGEKVYSPRMSACYGLADEICEYIADYIEEFRSLKRRYTFNDMDKLCAELTEKVNNSVNFVKLSDDETYYRSSKGKR